GRSVAGRHPTGHTEAHAARAAPDPEPGPRLARGPERRRLRALRARVSRAARATLRGRALALRCARRARAQQRRVPRLQLSHAAPAGGSPLPYRAGPLISARPLPRSGRALPSNARLTGPRRAGGGELPAARWRR